MPTWPAGLPQRPLKNGYSRSGQALLVRSTMDTGPAKVRLRAVAGVQPLMVAYHMSTAQLAIFRTFFATDIAYGALRFDLPDPEEGPSPLSVRMTGGAGSPAFSITPRSPGYWDVSFGLEIMP